MSMRSVGAVQLHPSPASMPEKIEVFISENTMVYAQTIRRFHGSNTQRCVILLLSYTSDTLLKSAQRLSACSRREAPPSCAGFTGQAPELLCQGSPGRSFND